jgi:hypothetical protein
VTLTIVPTQFCAFTGYDVYAIDCCLCDELYNGVLYSVGHPTCSGHNYTPGHDPDSVYRSVERFDSHTCCRHHDSLGHNHCLDHSDRVHHGPSSVVLDASADHSINS